MEAVAITSLSNILRTESYVSKYHPKRGRVHPWLMYSIPLHSMPIIC